MECIPVTLVMGPAGGGKTTLLNQLVQQQGGEGALVIQNEFGRTPLDHGLVVPIRSGPGPAGACICCTRSQDLFSTLKQAPWRFSRGGKRLFTRVFIEAPAQADPALLRQALQSQRLLSEQYAVTSVLVIIDAARAMQMLHTDPVVVQQVRLADCIVVSWPERLEAASRDVLLTALSGLNEHAPRLLAPGGVVDSADLACSTIFAPKGQVKGKHE